MSDIQWFVVIFFGSLILAYIIIMILLSCDNGREIKKKESEHETIRPVKTEPVSVTKPKDNSSTVKKKNTDGGTWSVQYAEGRHDSYDDNQYSPERRAGKEGEATAASYFRSVLKTDDHCIRNVSLSSDDSYAELDYVIVNQKGIFIVEVKNYAGELEGEPDDYKLKKYRYDNRGRLLEASEEKNPLPQVNRQVNILEYYLEKFNIGVKPEGYVYFLNDNCPYEDSHVLSDRNEFSKAIHNRKNRLTKEEVERIVNIISNSR